MIRSDSVEIEQARARNNSWYMILPADAAPGDSRDGSTDLRYASQSANTRIAAAVSSDQAKLAAEAHADRYDTRE